MSEERKGRRASAAEGPAGGSAEAAPSDSPSPGAGAPAAGPADAAEDVAVLKDRWLRAEADLQNFRRRAAREREETRRSAEEAVLLEVITALDDLERALASVPESSPPQPWVEGVRLVGSRLVEYLGRQGVVAPDPVGQRFDPVFDEAVLEMVVPGVAPGHVTQVLLRGWRRGARALRAGRVIVAREPDEGTG